MAVIGAGPGGLAALRHLSTKPELYAPRAFEKNSVIGGMWNYSDETVDKNGFPVHSSIYKNMRMNAQTDLMQYTDFPFAKDTPRLCSHIDAKHYIEEYAKHFKLKKFIYFDTVVTKIEPFESTTGNLLWKIHKKNVKYMERTAEIELFDAVIIAAGVCSAPNYPDIPGLKEFKGKVIHSFDYRVPNMFAGMRVAVLGGLISGQDISVDVSQFAKEVIFCHKGDPLAWELPKNMRQCVPIERLSHNKAIMLDGTEYEIDGLILCTGYKKHLPFLSPECRVKIEEERITPLYKHVIHTEFPTMTFIGYNQFCLAFINCEIQVKFIMAAWEGRYKLPSTDEMNADTQRDLEMRESLDMPASKGHHLGFLKPAYHDQLARLGQFDPLSRHLYGIFVTNLEMIVTGLTYKDYDFKRDETGKIDLEMFKEFFINEQKNSTCGMEEIRRRLNNIKRPQKMF